LKDNRDDAPTTYLMALLHFPDESAAAQEEFQRLLADPERRQVLLLRPKRQIRVRR